MTLVVEMMLVVIVYVEFASGHVVVHSMFAFLLSLMML